MITTQELQALLQIVQRAPITRGESIFLTVIFEKLTQQIESSLEQQEEPPGDQETPQIEQLRPDPLIGPV